jgi:predicted anti-sigma-YlaC factor YlaD
VQYRILRFYSAVVALSAAKRGIALSITLLAGMNTACVTKFAVGKLGNALAKSGTTFASDNDPDLVRDAVPFSLKLIESLLAENPRHRGLLLAATSGFTQYAYAFVQQYADELESQNLKKATFLRVRARRLYLRARDYGLRGLETKHKGFEAALRKDPKRTARVASRGDVPLLYWTAAAWGSAISLSKDNPDLIADQPIVEALIDRALELDESFDHGAIHTFLIAYEPSRAGGKGDSAVRAREHFDRAMQLSAGHLAAPLVAFAETVSVSKQKRKEFDSLLQQALELDVDARPESRLANLVAQRRARWLLEHADQLFVE